MHLIKVLVVLLVFILINYSVTAYQPPNFDGPLNLQSGLNYINHAEFKQDYGKQGWLQTHIPFQALNAYVVRFTGVTPLGLNLVNFLYALLLTGLFLSILSISRSWITVAAFAWFYSHQVTLEGSFFGFGDLPVWSFLIIGVYFALIRQQAILAGLLIGLSFATKWIVWMSAPLICYYFFRSLSLRKFLQFSVAFSLVLLFCWMSEYPHFPTEIFNQGQRILAHALPGDIEAHPAASVLTFSSYTSQLKMHLSEFTRYQIWGCLLTLSLVFWIIKSSTVTIDSRDKYYQFIKFMLLLVVMVAIWYLFFSSRTWSRRFYPIPMLTALSVGILPVFLKEKIKQSKIVICLSLLMIISSLFVIPNSFERDFRNRDLFATLNQNKINFSPDANYFTFGFWQAPLSALVLEKTPLDLFVVPLMEQRGESYLLLEPTSSAHGDFDNFIKERYELEIIEGYGKYRTAIIKGLLPEQIVTFPYVPKKYAERAYMNGAIMNDERMFVFEPQPFDRKLQIKFTASACFSGNLFVLLGDQKSSFALNSNEINLKIPAGVDRFTIWHSASPLCQYQADKPVTYDQLFLTTGN